MPYLVRIRLLLLLLGLGLAPVVVVALANQRQSVEPAPHAEMPLFGWPTTAEPKKPMPVPRWIVTTESYRDDPMTVIEDRATKVCYAVYDRAVLLGTVPCR